MPKRPGDFEEFSIEEIIAEIKAETGGKKPPVSVAPPVREALAAPAGAAASEAGAASARPGPPPLDFKPPPRPEPPPPARKTEPPIEAAAGRRPRAASRPQGEPKAALPTDGQPQAPWRTQPKQVFAQVQSQDTQEFEIILESPDPVGPAPEAEVGGEAAQAPPLRYDFINLVYDDAQAAVRILDKRTLSLAARILLLVPLLALSGYMTVCLPYGLPMPFGFTYSNHPYLYLTAFAVLHILAIGLSGEVTAAGLMRLARLRPTLDSLVLFGQLCILAHTLSIMAKPRWGGYLPYTCVGIFTCLVALAAKRQRGEILRRTYRASLLGTAPTAVKLAEEGGVRMAVKSEEGVWVEMETFARRDATERLGEYLSPIAMAAICGLALAASLGQGRPESLPWSLAALAAAGAPVSLLLSASLPGRKLAKKLFASGSALINPQRAKRLARCTAAVLRDGDIFPVGAVEIVGLKVAAAQKLERVVGCAAAMTREIGGGLARALDEFARTQYIPALRADNVRFFESGGLSAQVEGRYVLLGTVSFMMRMGVRVTEGVNLPSSLFLAVDGAFAGVFSLKYGVQSQAYAAFRALRQARVTPVAATRDINLSQAYVESRFDLRAGSVEYPDLPERLRLSEPGLGGQEEALAFLSRDGMLPFAEAVLAAKKQRRAARLGQVIGLAALAAGLLLMYFLAYNMKAAAAAPHNVLLYLALWLVPTGLASAMTTRM